MLLQLPWALCLAALAPLPAGSGYVLHLESDCALSADGQALWANWTVAFNKVPFVCYDHGEQQFLPCGLGASYPWNYTSVPLSTWLDSQIPGQGEAARAACQGQTHSLWGRTGQRLTAPNVRIFPVTPQNTPAPIMLACVAWGFYPKEVAISWLQNGVPVKDGADELAVSSNGDWTYQARLTMPVDPKPGDTYTCRVVHASRPKPIDKYWAPGLPLEFRVRVGISAAVLGLGLIVFLTGYTCWKRRVPEGYVPIAGNTYPAEKD